MMTVTDLVSDTGHSSSVGSESASYASGPKIGTSVWHILSWKIYCPVPLIQEEQVVSFWQKNGY